MKVKVKKLSKDAVIPFKKYDSDFCYDCVAVSEEEIAPNVWKYGLGLAFEVDRGWNHVMVFGCVKGVMGRPLGREYNLSIDFRPRSSIYKTGMVLSNAVGTIDEGYRNEVSAIFYHVMPNMPRYKIGDKIGQIKIGLTLPIEFEEVEELSDSDRGMKGFGSTGK